MKLEKQLRLAPLRLAPFQAAKLFGELLVLLLRANHLGRKLEQDLFMHHTALSAAIASNLLPLR
jgi:hypothetical protein